MTHLLTFLFPASKLKDRIYVRVVSDIEIEYDNKLSEFSLRRTIVFYVSTGKPGGKRLVIYRVASLPLRERRV